MSSPQSPLYNIAPYEKQPIGATAPYHGSDEPLQAHHGVIDAFMRRNFSVYDHDTAPTIMLPESEHKNTDREYNRWTPGIPKIPDSRKIDWTNVTVAQIVDLTRKEFNAAHVPAEEIARYFAAFEKYCNEVIKNLAKIEKELPKVSHQVPIRTLIDETQSKQFRIDPNARLEAARTSDGVYRGPIISVMDGLMLQKQSSNRVIAHELQNFSTEFPNQIRQSLQSLKPGQEYSCRITYSQGKATCHQINQRQANQPGREQSRDAKGR